MLNEVSGKVIAVLPMQSGTSAKGEWKRQTVVVEFADGQYTSQLALDNMKKADEFAAIKVGSEIKVRYSVTSRESGGRWYTSANAVSWEVSAQPSAPSGTAPF